MAVVEEWALTTLEAAKEELDISDDSQNYRIARSVNAWSQRFNRETNRHLARRYYHWRLAGQGMLKLNLPEYPIICIDSVCLDGQVLTRGEADSDQDYIILSKEEGQLWRKWAWRWGAGAHPDLTSDPDPYSSDLNIEVRGWAGYVTPAQADADSSLIRDLPYDIEQGVLRAVQFDYLNNPGVKMEQTPGGHKTQLFDPLRGGDHGLLAELEPLWENYRKHDRAMT